MHCKGAQMTIKTFKKIPSKETKLSVPAQNATSGILIWLVSQQHTLPPDSPLGLGFPEVCLSGGQQCQRGHTG